MLDFDCDCNPRFSGNIEKLQSIPSFNIPAKKTCKHRTKACNVYCYADKGRFKWKPVQAMYEANYQASQCICFVDRICELLPFTVRAVRIHSAGDFYDNIYFQKWVEIARRKSNTIFLAYTRNYNLWLEDLPENLIVYYSVDNTTKKINPTAQRFARIVPYNKDAPHMKSYKTGVLCTSDDCSQCGYCWLTAEDVYFPQKYKTYSVSELEVNTK